MEKLSELLKAVLKVEDGKIHNLDRIFHLIEELTDITDQTIIWLIQYCDMHNIPLWREKQLKSYVNLSKIVMKEIEEQSIELKELIKSRKLPELQNPFYTKNTTPDDFLQRKRTDDNLTEPDIYVGIFWKKFGNKQPNGLTPTEEEFERALDSFKKNGKPLVLVYFKIDDYYPKNSLEAEQILKVINFKERIKPFGIFREFKEEEFFDHIIMKDIADKIRNYDWVKTAINGSK